MQLLKNANKIKENISVNFLYSSIFFKTKGFTENKTHYTWKHQSAFTKINV